MCCIVGNWLHWLSVLPHGVSFDLLSLVCAAYDFSLFRVVVYAWRSTERDDDNLLSRLPDPGRVVGICDIQLSRRTTFFLLVDPLKTGRVWLEI